MIYIVSGYMRSGTSMMMQALAAGGMEVAFNQNREDQLQQLNAKWGDFIVNKEFLELTRGDLEADNFPHAYDGKLIKAIWGALVYMWPCDARMVFMRRPQLEIMASTMAAFGEYPAPTLQPNFNRTIERCVSTLRDRRSFRSVDEVWYQDALEKPLEVFTHLKDMGWPIDPERCSAIPDKKYKRF